MTWLHRKSITPTNVVESDRRAIDAAVLERRILFSATPIAPPIAEEPAVELPQTTLEPETAPPSNQSAPDATPSASQESSTEKRLELVFIDAGVGDHQQLIDDLQLDGEHRDLEVYLLDASRDGIEQITEILSSYDQVDAVHVLSHGNDGKLRLGDSVIQANNLDGYASDLASWQSALSGEADVLIYGCNVAETDSGRTLIQALSVLTGADVAASSDDTGHMLRGGNWDLEYQTGLIETTSTVNAFSNNDWIGLLAAPEISATDELRTNTTTAGDQQTQQPQQTVAVDGAGNSIVVWVDSNADGDGSGIFAQWFDSAGVKQGSEFQVNADATGNQSQPVVTVDDSGRFAIAFVSSDGDGSGIYLRRFDSSGNAIDTADLLVNAGQTVGEQTNVSIASNDSNQIVLSWHSSNASQGIFARNFDFTSAAAGNQLSTSLLAIDSAATATDAAIDINQSGRFVVVWKDGADLLARQYDFGSDTAVAAALDLSLPFQTGQNPAVAVMQNGDFVVVAQSETVSTEGIWQRLIHNDGSMESVLQISNDITAMDPSIDLDDNDQYVISYSKADADGRGVFYQGFDSSGLTIATEQAVNSTTAGTQSNASVAIHDVNNLVVAWSGNGTRGGHDDSSGVFLRQFHNSDPVVDLSAGTPYLINEGDSLILDGSNSTDFDADTISFAWDLDNDGVFGEIGEPVTASASVDWATLVGFGIDDDGTFQIGLRVQDGKGGQDIGTTTVTVENTRPTITVTGSGNATANESHTLNLAVSDPGDDNVSLWRVDWGDGTVALYSGSLTSVSHTYTVAGLTHNILVSAIDEDGRWFDGNLYLGSANANPLLRLDPLNGTLELSLGLSSLFEQGGADILFGPDGMLYASSYLSDNVQRFDPVTGTLINEFVAAGSGGLDRATGIAFGPDGNLYVASYNTDSILRYDGTTGAFIDEFVASGSGGLDGPTALSFFADGDLYVSGGNSDNILRFDGETGALVSEFITAGSGGLDGAESFAFGRDGNLYVASYNTDQILRFNATTGAFQDVFISAGLGGLDGPIGVAFGPDDLLYVTSSLSDTVLRYGSFGNLIDVFVPDSAGISSPSGIQFTPSGEVTVLPQNQAPQIDLDDDNSSGATGADYDAAFNEGGGAVLITDSSDAILTDVDNATLSSLTITITNLLDGGNETLTADTSGTSITASYVGGTLTLSNIDSVANYQQVLRTIRYDNSSLNPDTTTRLIQFVANDEQTNSNVATANVTITANNNAPTIDLDDDNSSGATGADYVAAFNEGGGAILISDSSDAILTDVDDATLSSLTITITNLLDGANETLTADTTGTSITASYVAGTLTLSNIDSVANYQQVLRTIRYDNSSLNPDTTTRQIQFVVNDGLSNSNVATANVTIAANNNAPTIDLDDDNSSGATGADYDAAFNEGGGAVLISDSSDAILTDVDDATLSSLTITIANLLDGANETLTADTTGTSITASYVAGTLTLSNIDSVANYQQVLRTIRYDNSSLNPDTTTRQIQFVANDGQSNSNVATANVTIAANNNAPTIDLDGDNSSGATGADYDTAFNEGGGAVLITDSSDAILTDVDDATLSSLTITITNLLDGGNETLTADTSGTSITASYVAGTLTLSNIDSVANYQQVLRTIRYDNSSVNPDTTTRQIQFVVNDGQTNSNVATANVTITANNNAPTIDLDGDNSSGATGEDYDTAFNEGGGAVLITDSSDAILTDVDNATLSSLTITIANLLDDGNETLTADTTGTSITASY
ncbi:DUF4347 domain-containing protein, partial [Stieleria sp. TO1_6]|uniref:DUF4347 domain-containing protein n=1 Tax=Stieleria tagensis TaxID=2956795 RepID=UPI00209B3739